VLAEIIGPDILIVLAILLVLFGGSQLPKLARNLGQAQKELRKGFTDGQEEVDAAPTGKAPTLAGLSSAAHAEAPSESQPQPADAPDTVTLTRAELDRLVDQRVRDAMGATEQGTKEPHQPG
jgi:sec-independent protein translocase protein TatA